MDGQAHDRALHTAHHRWRVTASHPDRPDYAMHWSSEEAANVDARYLEAMGYNDVAVTDLGGVAPPPLRAPETAGGATQSIR